MGERLTRTLLRGVVLPALGALALGSACSPGGGSTPDAGAPDSGASDSGAGASGADGGTVYDPLHHITWLADADLPASQRFGLPLCADGGTVGCINPSGSMSYQTAKAWVTAMNDAGHLGHGDWQLPTTPLTDLDGGCQFIGPADASFGFDCTAGALGSLYQDELGIQAPDTAVPLPSLDAGPFKNFQPYLYWSQTNTGGIGYATFSFNTGIHGSNTKPNYLYALPMLPGKIPGTPPASGAGLEVNPGGQTVYDPVTGVTWLADANVAASDTFGLPRCTAPGQPKHCVDRDGAMNWDSANQLVQNMADAGYLGQSGWELPPADLACDTEYYCDVGATNPMGELYYGQLGLAPGTPVVAIPDLAVGQFVNLKPYLYWSCLGPTIQGPCDASGPAPGFEFTFSFGNGFLGTDILKNEFYVTAYHPGR